jgi:hypothetical protein
MMSIQASTGDNDSSRREHRRSLNGDDRSSMFTKGEIWSQQEIGHDIKDAYPYSCGLLLYDRTLICEGLRQVS